MRRQFARVQAYKSTSSGDLLAEADRAVGACPHVTNPAPVAWHVGSAETVKAAIERHMESPEKLTMKTGQVVNRKRRKDSRALTAGILSWPDSWIQVKKDRAQFKLMQQWIFDCFAWLKSRYGDRLKGVCFHQDESHPHMHFFVVGECQKYHPGLAAEIINGKRISDRGERLVAYKSGLKSWLDDFQAQVGKQSNLERGEQIEKPAWRVKDRQIRAKIFEIDKRLKETPDSTLEAMRDDLYDASEHIPRVRMRF
jgi:hypothetical protein